MVPNLNLKSRRILELHAGSKLRLACVGIPRVPCPLIGRTLFSLCAYRHRYCSTRVTVQRSGERLGASLH
eukprot:3329252-Rhodomonas_salina.1